MLLDLLTVLDQHYTAHPQTQPSLMDLLSQQACHSNTSAFPLVTLGSSKCCRLIKLIHDALLSCCIIFCLVYYIFLHDNTFATRSSMLSLVYNALCSIKAMATNLISYLTGAWCVIVVPQHSLTSHTAYHPMCSAVVCLFVTVAQRLRDSLLLF